MRWIKHLSDAHSDEKLATLRAECGFEGYGFYWFVLEILAKRVDEKNSKTSVTYPIKFWCQLAGSLPSRFQRLVNSCATLGLLSVNIDGNSMTIGCPNILKYRDEWSRKKAKNSGVTPEQLRSKDTDTDTDTELDKDSEDKKSSSVAKPKRERQDRPNQCPPEKWEKYVLFSRKFHEDRSNVLGAIAPFTEKKVIDGARALDNMVRVRGIDPQEIQAVLAWAITDTFWCDNVRAIASLLKIGSNGETKYANILAAMRREVAS